MFYVYILQSKIDGTFYTGMTSDVDQRLKEHNSSVTKTTRSRKPWSLVFTEECDTRELAREREKYWKSGIGREKRDRLLERQV